MLQIFVCIDFNRFKQGSGKSRVEVIAAWYSMGQALSTEPIHSPAKAAYIRPAVSPTLYIGLPHTAMVMHLPPDLTLPLLFLTTLQIGIS